MHPDVLLPTDPTLRPIARDLYKSIANLPLICPHGHVDPRVFADADYSFGTPTQLFIIPDHYVFRMLYSQGITLESLGIAHKPGAPTDGGEIERDHRKIWQTFAEHFYLFRGTPTGVWVEQSLSDVFGVHETLSTANAQKNYDHIADCLTRAEFRPRALFDRFNIEALTTTDAATDTLAHHATIKRDWRGRILPTFRPDAVVNIDTENWRANIDTLSAVSGVDVRDYRTFIQALEQRRAFFRQMGTTATDHAAITAHTERLSDGEAEDIFARALMGAADASDAAQFTAHMLNEMARMSREDGLVMQLHIGSLRNHNRTIFERFGRDMGADIPVATEFTRGLQPLLNDYANDARFKAILFTLDEATYSRELAPLAGHYPALKLGPPWWFFDSPNGMRRYFDLVMETCGIYNTAGFNDDTRAYCSIPARHDVWRRMVAGWLAGLVAQHWVNEAAAYDMAHEMAYDLAKKAYQL